MQLDAVPLEPTFFEDVARRGIDDPGSGNQLLDVEFLKGEIDHRARSLGAEAPAPMLDAKPVAEFRTFRFAPVDADDADRLVVALDQKYSFTPVIGDGADE